MEYEVRFWSWAVVLCGLAMASIVGSICILRTDTTVNLANTQEKIPLIAEAVTLELLPQVVKPEPDAIAELVRVAVDETLPDVSQRTKDQIGALVATSGIEAAEAIRVSAAASLEKDIFGESEVHGPARSVLIDSTLASLNLFDGDVTDPSSLDAELADAAAVALTLPSGFVSVSDRPDVQQSTVDALAFAIDSNIESAATDTLMDLSLDAVTDINLERLGRLDGNALRWADVFTLPPVAGMGGLAFQQLLSLMTDRIVRRRDQWLDGSLV